MNILWVCNCKPSGFDNSSQLNSGGWMTGVLSELIKISGLNIHIVYPGKETADIQKKDSVSYGSIQSIGNCLKYDDEFYKGIKSLLSKEQFDVIHIWGTEFPHALSTVNACKECGLEDRVTVWIQGLCSVYAKHYYAGLPRKAFCMASFHDVVKRDTLPAQKRKFLKRGGFEKEVLQNVRHICGRTDWDKAAAKSINPKAKYHYCGEVLRKEFYGNEAWSINSCEKFRIFTSQATYPIKGLHRLLKAVLSLYKKYPHIKLYVAGYDITSADFFHKSTYGKYLKYYIKKHNLQEYVHFTGRLTASKMAEQYKKANVFVLPSSIENSPNSLGEAMLTGTPCVASDVGGVKNMMTHGSEGFIYPFEENYMLESYIDELFSDDALAEKFSHNAREHAKITHSPEENAKTLIEIYEEIRRN